MNDAISISRERIRGAWLGRVSGCLLGKPLEVLSFREGRDGLRRYLEQAEAWPLRDYAPLVEGTVVERRAKNCCAGFIERAEPDDDINYTILALTLLERHGADLSTEDVARAWLTLLPGGATWTAERAANRMILDRMDDVDLWHNFLIDHGTPIEAPPRTHRDGARSFYCRDPDGTLVQLIYHPPLSTA